MDNDDVTEAVDDTDLGALRVDVALSEPRALDVTDVQADIERDESAVAEERKDEDAVSTPERVAELDKEERGDALLAPLGDADVESDADALGDCDSDGDWLSVAEDVPTTVSEGDRNLAVPVGKMEPVRVAVLLLDADTETLAVASTVKDWVTDGVGESDGRPVSVADREAPTVVEGVGLWVRVVAGDAVRIDLLGDGDVLPDAVCSVDEEIVIVVMTESEACEDQVCDWVNSGDKEAVRDGAAEPLADGCREVDTVGLASTEEDINTEDECTSVREAKIDRLASTDDEADTDSSDVKDCAADAEALPASDAVESGDGESKDGEDAADADDDTDDDASGDGLIEDDVSGETESSGEGLDDSSGDELAEDDVCGEIDFSGEALTDEQDDIDTLLDGSGESEARAERLAVCDTLARMEDVGVTERDAVCVSDARAVGKLLDGEIVGDKLFDAEIDGDTVRNAVGEKRDDADIDARAVGKLRVGETVTEELVERVVAAEKLCEPERV